jgi:hypothetical protein
MAEMPTARPLSATQPEERNRVGGMKDQATLPLTGSQQPQRGGSGEGK